MDPLDVAPGLGIEVSAEFQCLVKCPVGRNRPTTRADHLVPARNLIRIRIGGRIGGQSAHNWVRPYWKMPQFFFTLRRYPVLRRERGGEFVNRAVRTGEEKAVEECRFTHGSQSK